MELFLIDGIGPFFRNLPPGRINWSKIPFTALECDGQPDPARFEQIQEDFKRFAERAAQAGYNAITLDDVAHLVTCSAYPEELRRKIDFYRTEYRRLFATAQQAGLKVFITTDVMFYHESLKALLGRSRGHITRFLKEALRQLFADFPEIAGIILRIGESDGHDVKGDFISRLTIKTAPQANRFIKALLPVFEEADRLMIFRTWTVGTWPIGDLIWNRNTFRRTFNGIRSDQFIISMKYGESDFFRFLPLNKLFFQSPHRKIVELQARREYEGFGEFPSFIGWDTEKYARQLLQAENMAGIQVWCQSGGWSSFRNLTWVENSSIWNEINVEAALNIFKYGWTTEKAVRRWAKQNLKKGHWLQLLQLLRLSDEVIKELLYLEEFSRSKIFFRRLRVPPLLWALWDRIFINNMVRLLLRLHVRHREEAVIEGRAALKKIKMMKRLAKSLGLPVKCFDFQHDTFRFLAAAREYCFRPVTDELVEKINGLKTEYEAAYETPYEIQFDPAAGRIRKVHLRFFTALFFRHRRGYRLFDRFLTLHGLKLLYPLIRKRHVPAFARKQAMGIDALFK
jgi:hypothetical protein